MKRITLDIRLHHYIPYDEYIIKDKEKLKSNIKNFIKPFPFLNADYNI